MQNRPPNDGVDAIGTNQEIENVSLASFSGHRDLTIILIIVFGDPRIDNHICSTVLLQSLPVPHGDEPCARPWKVLKSALLSQSRKELVKDVKQLMHHEKQRLHAVAA